MLPYLLLLFSLALAARRLIDARAYPLAFLALFFAGSTNGMFMPERIDHHGWQLALLALCIAAIADPKRVRGGLMLGISTALSLAIGLEMIIYLAIAGVGDGAVLGRRRRRARAAARLCGVAGRRDGARASCCSLPTTIAARCATLCRRCGCPTRCSAGRAFMALAWVSPADWKRRLALAVAAGAVVAGFHALIWPHCIQRLEGVSPEVDRLWLSHVKEARPIYRHGWRIATLIFALAGHRRDRLGLLAWIRRARPRAAAADRSARPRRASPRPCCCCGRRAPARPRR